MSRRSASSYVENTMGLLVEEFGIGRVRAALAKVSNGDANVFESHPRRQFGKPDKQAKSSVTSTLEQLREKDPERHRLLTTFYMRLKDKMVLPESQDIRQFAQVIGLKDIDGKSRKDMLPKLMRFLIEQPTERLRVDVEAAANVSEQHRKQGFSVLTDKLLAGTAKGSGR